MPHAKAARSCPVVTKLIIRAMDRTATPVAVDFRLWSAHEKCAGIVDIERHCRFAAVLTRQQAVNGEKQVGNAGLP
jgi:hypothetical protein